VSVIPLASSAVRINSKQGDPHCCFHTGSNSAEKQNQKNKGKCLPLVILTQDLHGGSETTVLGNISIKDQPTYLEAMGLSITKKSLSSPHPSKRNPRT
jgi:hypothetical protein